MRSADGDISTVGEGHIRRMTECVWRNVCLVVLIISFCRMVHQKQSCLAHFSRFWIPVRSSFTLASRLSTRAVYLWHSDPFGMSVHFVLCTISSCCILGAPCRFLVKFCFWQTFCDLLSARTCISGAPEPEPFAKPRPKPSERKNLPFYERQETESSCTVAAWTHRGQSRELRHRAALFLFENTSGCVF